METTVDLAAQTSVSQKVPVVQTWGLKKVYRTGFWLNQRVTPLQDCSLTVLPGETFGLLGPNGAGKTTLLKCLLGIVRPTAGRGVVLSQPLGNRAVKQHLGYLPENPYFYDYLTGWEFLQFTAGLFQIPAHLQRQRIPQLLDRVGLSPSAARKQQLRQYSKGMLQRLGMAQALINDPDLVFLDEPMSGLDPSGRHQIREIILCLKQQGKTIFFNSHVLADVEAICDRVAILAQGELICQGSLDQLLGTTAHYQVQGRGGRPETLKQWIPELAYQGGTWQGQLQGDPQAFMAQLSQMEAQLISLNLGRQSLEAFFLQQIELRRLSSSR